MGSPAGAGTNRDPIMCRVGWQAIGSFRSAGSDHRFQAVRTDDWQPGRQLALRTEKSGNPLPHSTPVHLVRLNLMS